MTTFTPDAAKPGERPVSRRSFIKRFGAGLLAAAFVVFDPSRAPAQAAVESSATTGEGFAGDGSAAPAAATTLWSKTTFTAHIGQLFTVSPGGSALQVKLVKVVGGPAAIYRAPKTVLQGAADASFELVFSGPRNRKLKEGMYLFQHPQLGKFSLFIARGIVSSDGQHYTAVVDRVRA